METLLPIHYLKSLSFKTNFPMQKERLKMKKTKLIAVILFQALLIVGLIQFYGCNNQLCCLQYEVGSDMATYCNNHRDAVGKFIRKVDGESEQKIRLSNFIQFYESIKSCTTVECIETMINSDTSLPGFETIYEHEHQYAEQDTQVDSSLKAKLILCGFKHAIDAMEQNLYE